ncbi:MAG TPA: YlxR family protein [Streptosporangiaceae bacterium]|nr:YlxR family protein [Streptosporangiaceae bacterium]
MARRSPRPLRSAPVIRMCVGCGVRAAKSDLLRLVAAGNEVVPDPRARQAGRGAYLHPSRGCLERAQRRRAFPRALRLPGPLGTGMIAGYLGAYQGGGKLPGQGGQTEGMDGSSAGESRLR